jgi:hypothetical protein
MGLEFPQPQPSPQPQPQPSPPPDFILHVVGGDANNGT